MLTSVVYLDVSENLLSQVDGLENMKALKALKVAFNRITNFQGLRLLTYNR
jgi:Leucine-rich repeat (LRR) protein